MKHKLSWIEEKNWQGKKFLEATLEGEGEKKVSIWPPFPVDTLKPGDEVEGDLIQNDKGYWSLKPIKANPFANKPAWAKKDIAQAQERKAEYIEKAQDRKNESIAYFNAINSAIALMPILKDEFGFDETGAKSFIPKWRDWFLSEWKKYEAGGHEDKHSPGF